MFTTHRIIGAASALVLTLAALPALASPAGPLLTPAPGAKAAYHVEFSGTFWNGEKRSFARDVRLTVAAAPAVQYVSSGTSAADNATGNGTLQADGTVKLDASQERLESFNTVARVLSKAPAAIAPGTSFQAVVPVSYTQNGTTADVPVTLKAVADGEHGIVLQGTGAQTVQTSFAGFAVPIDMSVQLAMRLTDGRLARADLAVSELVHAGPQEQTLTWKWAMTSLPPA